MASKQPQRSDLTSDFKFMTQITYATMFVCIVLTLYGPNGGKKKERRKKDNSPLLELLGFAATKNTYMSLGKIYGTKYGTIDIKIWQKIKGH